MINIERRDKIDIITFTIKSINALVTEELKEEINGALQNGSTRVVLSLKNVEYIDSSGFGCLLSIMRTARNNYCMLKLAAPEPAVLKVLNTLNLNTVFEIFEDVDECVRSMR